MAAVENESLGIKWKQAITNGLEDTVNYFRVSPQLYIPDLIYGSLISLYDYQLVQRNSGFNQTEWGFMIPVTGFGLMLFIANRFKAFENLTDYKKIRAMLKQHSWDERVIDAMQETVCNRMVARTAAVDEGFKPEIKQYYKKGCN